MLIVNYLSSVIHQLGMDKVSNSFLHHFYITEVNYMCYVLNIKGLSLLARQKLFIHKIYSEEYKHVNPYGIRPGFKISIVF